MAMQSSPEVLNPGMKKLLRFNFSAQLNYAIHIISYHIIYMHAKSLRTRLLKTCKAIELVRVMRYL